MKRIVLLSMSLAAAIAVVAGAGRTGYASDHDDGETDLKARALNLSDHFAFKTKDNQLALIMYFNPRGLPGKQYFLSTKARYELHVSKVAGKTAAPTNKDDYLFRFEAAEPDATGAQAITLTMFKDGQKVGTHTGKTTTIAASRANAIADNKGKIGNYDVRYFVGPRADSFAFDVVRFFQVRAFLADRFFGGEGGKGNAGATLADNCRGDKFLGAENGPSDGDNINLFNPPSCAPDFTKNLNVTAIVLDVPIAQLDDNTIFDTWSTISVAE